MSSKIISSTWTSIVLATQGIIGNVSGLYDEPLEFVDWEKHANLHELPKADLIGPTALSISEDDAEFFVVNFAIGVCTTTTDENLFRLRDYIDKVFASMRFGQKFNFFDVETNRVTGLMHFTAGTTLTPMTRAETRPWQYVQASALLEPFTSE